MDAHADDGRVVPGRNHRWRSMEARYMYDAEMLGPEFCGSAKDLPRFIEILAEQTERPLTDFGIGQRIHQPIGSVGPSEYDFLTALAQFTRERPDLFSEVEE
jgi:hypothetical protein